jgi:hypothetical protein
MMFTKNGVKYLVTDLWLWAECDPDHPDVLPWDVDDSAWRPVLRLGRIRP